MGAFIRMPGPGKHLDKGHPTSLHPLGIRLHLRPLVPASKSFQWLDRPSAWITCGSSPRLGATRQNQEAQGCVLVVLNPGSLRIHRELLLGGIISFAWLLFYKIEVDSTVRLDVLMGGDLNFH